MDLMTCKDVMASLGICETNAYALIRRLNAELNAKGYITIRGKVPRKYFMERFYN